MGDYLECADVTIGNYIVKVFSAGAVLKSRFTGFESSPALKPKFYEIVGFPQMIGVIDSTHIKIGFTDTRRAQLFCCHHGFYSINLQVVCNTEQYITSIVVGWHESTHDNRIFDLCTPKAAFKENLNVNRLL